MPPPTEENGYHRLTDVWTKLLRIIENGERSGQGEGTQQPDEEINTDDSMTQNRDPNKLSVAPMGHLENRSASAMHSFRNFFDHPGQRKVGR